MIYLFDLFFVLCYLAFRQLLICAHDNNLSIYMKFRHLAIYVELSLILTFYYAGPDHTVSEAGVSLCMCMTEKFLFDMAVKNIKDL